MPWLCDDCDLQRHRGKQAPLQRWRTWARDVVFWFVVLIILWRLEHAVRVPYHLQLANKRSRALPAARAILHSHALERVFYDEDDDDHDDD